MNSNEQTTPQRGPGPRPLLLAIPLALLGILLVATTVQAVMLSKIQTTLAQFDRGIFDRTGMLDIPAMGIDSVQLLPIGLEGDWAEAAPLPVAIADMMAAQNGDFVYVIGGMAIDSFRSDVLRATMTLTDAITSWVPETPLPEPIASGSASVHPGSGGTSTLYVVGGIDSSYQSLDTVYRAQIDDATGAIVGGWQELASERLPVPMRYVETAVHGDYLYVIGGYNPSIVYNTVYYAAINPDGSLGPFTPTSPLPRPLMDSLVVVYDGDPVDTMYMIGGRNRTTSTFEVYFADFQATGGGLSTWQQSQGDLPLHVYAHDGVLLNGEIILTGGTLDPTNPGEGISQTIKAAVVDENNALFRLYDWCGGVPPPTCTIGAWQTGGLLPEVRAFHSTVTDHGWVYVMGGMSGEVRPTNTVYYIKVRGVGSLYSPYGTYTSENMRLANFPANVHRVTWDATLGHPGNMGLEMQFRTSLNGTSWSPWSEPVASASGANEYVFSPLVEDVRYFQYRGIFTTTVPNASPLLDEVEVFYELDDPDLQVRKDAGEVTAVDPGATVNYYVYYTNTGEYRAQHTTITETVPNYASYAGTGWQRVGSTKVFTYPLQNVPPGESGMVPFRVKVNSWVPDAVNQIINNVEINFRPFVDVAGRTIVDPVPADNEYTFPLTVNKVGLIIRKRAVPPAGSEVLPGDRITYTVVYTNSGTRDLTEGVITDEYDPSGSYDILQIDPPPSSGNNVWTVPQLPVGASGEISIVVQVVTTPLPNHWWTRNEAGIDTAEATPKASPVVTHTVLQPPMDRVDLVIEDVTWEPANPLTGESTRFQATVANQGPLAASDMFWVELYVKPQPSEPPLWPSDHDYGFCVDDCARYRYRNAKNVNSLAAGGETTIYFEEMLTGTNSLEPGLYDVYVQVDTAYQLPGHNLYWGVYAEEYEYNNVWRGVIAIEDNGWPGKVYLPMVYKWTSH